MIVKIIALFLAFMAVLAMFGKLRTPKLPRLTAKKCPSCGRHKIGRGPCACGKGQG